jgi:hypothetical protein
MTFWMTHHLESSQRRRCRSPCALPESCAAARPRTWTISCECRRGALWHWRGDDSCSDITNPLELIRPQPLTRNGNTMLMVMQHLSHCSSLAWISKLHVCKNFQHEVTGYRNIARDLAAFHTGSCESCAFQATTMGRLLCIYRVTLLVSIGWAMGKRANEHTRKPFPL